MGLPNRLRERREQLGLTQGEVAAILGITPGAVGNYENGVSTPKADILFKVFNALKCDANYLFQDEMNNLKHEDSATPYEMDHLVKKYRGLDDTGRKHIDIIMDWETFRVQQLQKAETTVIDFQSHTNGHLVTYYRSASAGTGVFILGNEASEQLSIPDTPENRLVDYAIGVSGDSMEPDYHDGDIVLVSQRVEMYHGDVGIFIINNKAYIKEYGETELISRNPDAPSIQISEYDNIVCMGKVIGKL